MSAFWAQIYTSLGITNFTECPGHHLITAYVLSLIRYASVNSFGKIKITSGFQFLPFHERDLMN